MQYEDYAFTLLWFCNISFYSGAKLFSWLSLWILPAAGLLPFLLLCLFESAKVLRSSEASDQLQAPYFILDPVSDTVHQNGLIESWFFIDMPLSKPCLCHFHVTCHGKYETLMENSCPSLTYFLLLLQGSQIFVWFDPDEADAAFTTFFKIQVNQPRTADIADRIQAVSWCVPKPKSIWANFDV